MPWFKVDDNLAFHAKTVAAGNPAMGLWVRAGAWAAQQLTDGHIPDHMLLALGTKRQADRLIQVGLWKREESGYSFHEWSERQPAKENVKAEQALSRERMRAYRARRKGNPPTPPQDEKPQVSDLRYGERSPVRSPVRSDDVTPYVQEKYENVRQPRPCPDPTRPDPVTTSDLARSPNANAVDRPETSQTLLAEWIDHCHEQPPGKVKGQIAKEIKTMLDEGISYERVRRGLAEWNAKDLHPSVLPSIVHGIGNRVNGAISRRQAETDNLFAAAMQRASERDRAVGE